MQLKTGKIYLIEKIISIFSYVTMGIIGLIWFALAYFQNKKPRFFLMYNIVQSMIISIFLAILKLVGDIIFTILSKIPFIDYLAVKIHYNIISYKIIRIYSLGISLTAFEFLLALLILYIIIGVAIGRIFYIPFLSDFMNKAMKNYN